VFKLLVKKISQKYILNFEIDFFEFERKKNKIREITLSSDVFFNCTAESGIFLPYIYIFFMYYMKTVFFLHHSKSVTKIYQIKKPHQS